jgi:RsiW-degrading membrane proteinase PrsW (M82 family)
MTDLGLRIAVGFLPALLFLVVLIYLDSYKLVKLRTVLGTLLAGVLAAAASYLINVAALRGSGMDFTTYSRYIGPVMEEIAKGAVLAYFIRANKVGFLVDAAIFGFGIGAGFALFENLYYFNLLPEATLIVWVVRGFGTAIMHGGVTAIFGIISKTYWDEHPSWGLAAFLPGLLLAMVVHSAFNHFFLNPVLSTALIVLLLPPMISFVFLRSEQALRSWLDVGFDADTELLELIHSGRFSDSRVGSYLHSLKEKFRGEVVADLLCYLRLHTELSLRAKGVLMMKEAGFRPEIDPETRATFQEMEYLERSIGRTGKLALAPFLHISGKELWQLYMLR